MWTLFSGRSIVKDNSWDPNDDVARLEIFISKEYPNFKLFFSTPNTTTNASCGE